MDTNRYSGVQNYQLYKQLINEERRKSGKYAPSEQPDIPSETEAQELQAWRAQQQRAVEAMGKTQATNFFSHMNSVARGKESGVAKQSRPRSQWEGMGQEEQSKVTSTNLYNMFREVEEGEKNEGWGMPKREAAYEVKGKGGKPLSEEDENYEFYDDPFVLQKPVLDNEGNIIQENQNLLQEAVTEQYEKSRVENYEQTHEQVKEVEEAGKEAADMCLGEGIKRDIVTQEQALNYINGYMSEEEMLELSEEQLKVIQAWSMLNMAYETAKDYIFMRGEYGEYTNEYLKSLEKQMDRLITFEDRTWERLEYYGWEFIYGVCETVETAADYVAAGMVWLGGQVGALMLATMGEEEYEKHLAYWDKQAAGILEDNWSRRQSEQNAKNHAASAFERKVGGMVSALGAMGPISLASAINPVAGAALSGLNTAGRTSREALEAGNTAGAALGYGLVAGSIDFTLNAVAGKAFQARGQKGWGNEFVSRVAKTKGGDVALRTIAGTLVDTGADTFSLIAQHNLRKMYNPSYEGKLDEGEIFKTIAVSLVMNGGMRLGSNLGGVYESNADGTLKPLEEAKLMGQLGGELEGPDRLKPKEVETFQEMELEGDESSGLSELFQDAEADRPVVETGGVEVEAKPSGVEADKSDIINNKASYGEDFGKIGVYVEKPELNVDWNQYAEHGNARIAERGLTQESVEKIIQEGKVLSQNKGEKFVFVSKEGVVVVSKTGKLITGYGKDRFDGNLMMILERLFGKDE